MSTNEMTLFQGQQLPDYFSQQELSDSTKALMGNAAGGPRLSIKGSVFRKIVGGKEVTRSEERKMNVVIVDNAVHIARTYYAGKFVEGENVPPTCWASDGITPDADVKDKQSETCATCKWNIAGSGEGESRACRYSQRLAVVLEGDLEGDVLQLQLPAQSIFGTGEPDKMPMQQFGKVLAGFKVNSYSIVTELRFDTDSATPKLVFRPVRPLTAAEYAIAVTQRNSQAAKEAITFSVFTQNGGTTPPTNEADAAVLTAAAAAPANAHKAEPAEEAPAAAHKRTRRTKAEIAADTAAAAAAPVVTDGLSDEEAALVAQLEAARTRKAAAAKAEADAKAAAEAKAKADALAAANPADAEEAALMARIAAIQARKTVEAAASGAAAPADPVVRATATSTTGVQDAASVLASWASDD